MGRRQDCPFRLRTGQGTRGSNICLCVTKGTDHGLEELRQQGRGRCGDGGGEMWIAKRLRERTGCED